jgi:glucose-6-phosphate-specific signal transduction histidine kinase
MSQTFDVDSQFRILVYMLVQCFGIHQGVEDMIDATRRMLADVMKKLEPKMPLAYIDEESAPRRRIPSAYHKEIRQFVAAMAKSYRIVGHISDTSDLESDKESLEQPANAIPVSGATPRNLKKRKSVVLMTRLIFREIATRLGKTKCR